MSEPQVTVRILGDNADAKAKVAEAISALEGMTRALNVHNQKAVSAWKSEASAVREMAQAVGASPQQFEKLDAVVNRTENRIDRLDHRAHRATENIALGFSSLGDSTKGFEGGIDHILRGADSLAFAFGAGGVVVMAVALSALAIRKLIEDSKREMEEMTKAAEDNVARVKALGRSDVAGISLSQAESNVARLRAEIARKQADTVSSTELDAMGGGTGRTVTTARDPGGIIDLQKKLELFQHIADEMGVIARETTKRNRDEEVGGDLTARRAAAMAEVVQLESRRNVFGEMTLRSDRIALAVAQGRLEALREQSRHSNLNHETLQKALNTEQRQLEKQLETIRETRHLEQQRILEKFKPNLQPENAAPDKTITFVRIKAVQDDMSSAITPMVTSIDTVTFAIHGMNEALFLVGENAKKQFGSLESISDAAHAAIANSTQKGLQALISGHENVGKVLKRAAAEPIVAALQMRGIEQAQKAIGALADFNFPQAALHAAAAAGFFTGANKVASLGGIGGGGGGGSGGGGSGSGGNTGNVSPGTAVGAAAQSQPLKIEIVVLQKDADGRQIAQIRQKVQRLIDKSQPIRMTL